MIPIKRWTMLLILLVLCATVYADLTIGSIPYQTGSQTDEPSFTYRVKRGETLISILEAHSELPQKINHQELSEAFSRLNNGLPPSGIQPGTEYVFPLAADWPIHIIVISISTLLK